VTCRLRISTNRALSTILTLILSATACVTGVPPRAIEGASTLTTATDEDGKGGQKGGSTPSPLPGRRRCNPLPAQHGRNDGLLTQPEDNPRAMRAYADTLCFVERSGLPGEPASHLESKGANGTVLWLLPERHVHKLSTVDLRGPRGRIVARVWNSDPWRRDFPEWPALRHGYGPAYLWIGPDPNSPGRTVSKVFKFRGRDNVEIVRVGSYADEIHDHQPYRYARAAWGDPHPRLKEIRTGHNVGWIDCNTGCCSATQLW
jgi:hypothetical protein